MSNMVTWDLPPKTGRSLSSALMARRFFASCSPFRLMYAHSFLVSSVRGIGELPTTAESALSGCTGRMKAALGVRFLPDFFAAFLAGRRAAFLADFLADFLAFFLAAIACLPVNVRTACLSSAATTETNSTQPPQIYNREIAVFPRKTAEKPRFWPGFPSET